MTKQYNERHGGPYDRGRADSYYQRGYDPHFYRGHTGDRRVEKKDMTSDEIEDYRAGYNWNEYFGARKDWD